MNSTKIRNLNIEFPIYLPDATRGVVKSLDTKDLFNVGIEGVVVNTLHLAEKPGLEHLETHGGIKNLMGFNGLVVSDSGGWQIFSLIHRCKNKGELTDKGVVFSIGTGKKELFTPEESIRTQFGIGADILICLDDFTDPTASKKNIQKSIDRTVLWAKKCKDEYERLLEEKRLTNVDRPLLFSVIQGGFDKDLRAECAERLIEIGFDGYGYGGYAIDENGLNLDLSKYIAELIPEDKLSFALGVGKPHDIATLATYGWHIFDCTLPTRDARHGRLYGFTKKPNAIEELLSKDTYEHIYIKRAKYSQDMQPIDSTCDCLVCKEHSRAYIHHLFKIADLSAYRLASIHNLRVYIRLVQFLRLYLFGKNHSSGIGRS